MLDINDLSDAELDAIALNQVVAPRAADGAWRKSTFTASALQGMAFEAIKYIVPDLIPEGLTILAGRPKVGKSWMALDIGIASSSDGYCLGDRKPLHGDVLYCALEDNKRRLKKRIQKVLGARDTPWPARLTLATSWRRLNEGGVQDIQQWANSVPAPALVILDTLASVRPSRNHNDTLYDGDYKALTEMHAWANERGIAVIVLHHTRKMEAEDPLDSVSGSLGLTGCADTTMILARNGQGTTLYLRGRDIEEAEHAIMFDAGACRWMILGDASEVHRSDSRQAILTVLADATDLMSPNEIAAGTRLTRNNVDQLLFRMVSDGEVIKPSRGHYVSAKRQDLIPLKIPKNKKEGAQ